MRLCVLWKAPKPGESKTRLAAELGWEKTLTLYVAVLRDLDAALREGEGAIKVVPYKDGVSAEERHFPALNKSARPQPAGDLGVRMRQPFEDAWREGEETAVLIGSDAPGQNVATWLELGRLAREQGAVIGPAADGGYWAIGFRRDAWVPEVFSGIPWSTADVLAETVRRFEQAGREPALAGVRDDLDTLADAVLLYETGAFGPEARSAWENAT